jgi:hypothetical protein
MQSALSVGGGWVADGGIFHLLDTLQAFVERRKGAETGVKAVHMLTGAAVWKAAADGLWDRGLLDAALARGEKVQPGKPEESRNAVVGIVEYRDGFKAAVLALGSLVSEYLVAWRTKQKVESTLCYIPSENSNNFSMLVHGITQMIATGKPSHPVERTLLVSGALSQLMESRYQGEKRIETPELAVSYKASEKSWFAPGLGS